MPFNLQLDLFGAIEKFIEFRKANEWFKLLLQLGCSYFFSNRFAQGMALLAHRTALEAMGAGMVAGTVAAVLIWRRSPLTKGMMLALPAEEAKAELETDSQIINK